MEATHAEDVGTRRVGWIFRELAADLAHELGVGIVCEG